MKQQIVTDLQEEVKRLTKQVDAMDLQTQSSDYSLFTGQEQDLFQVHFDSVMNTLDNASARLEYYEDV